MDKASYKKLNLVFKQPAGTSRGVLKTKETYIIKLEKAGYVGYGECAVFRGLSFDDRPNYEQVLKQFLNHLETNGEVDFDKLVDWPSIRFGLETAMRALVNKSAFKVFDSPFARGKKAIQINGLIWMGQLDFMLQQLHEKVEQGFDCIKFKIGALNFKEELKLLEEIRNNSALQHIEIRVDANGAFDNTNVIGVLKELAKYNVHSIEQPVKAGNWELMKAVCETSPVKVALDEELIGITNSEEAKHLLDFIKPDCIILKPALIGGFAGSDFWIEQAEKRNIGWWVTSALESNVGLNAIAQYCGSKSINMPQGLGTGALFTNNIPSPLELKGQQMHLNSNSDMWDLSALEF